MFRSFLPLIVLFAALSACGVADLDDSESKNSTRATELRVAGPWVAPASTKAIAATQYVPVVDPPAVSPLGSCTSSNAFACSCTHPSCSPAYAGTKELDAYLRGRFGSLTSGGLYCCRQNSATTSVPKLSVHAVGRAIDLMVPMEGGDANNGLGDPVANWLVENAEFIGIQRVIWDRAFWNGERGFGLLSSNSLSHTNHIHVELTAAGAARLTPFFTSGASVGSCTARCEGTRIINQDCSSGDCAFYGATCLPGTPPMCGQPPPPEPPMAVAVPAAALPTMSLGGSPGRFNFITPTRVFDTRSASTQVIRGDGSTSGPLTAVGTNVVAIPGLLGGASSVWMNMTAVLPTEGGFLSVYPADTGVPETSSVNYVPGTVRGNAVPVILGTGNRIAIDTLSDVNVIGDLTGAFAPTGDGLTSTPPTRVLDTRSAGIPIAAGAILQVDVQAPAGATGVVATVAAISGATPGFITAFACGDNVPETSNLNYAANSVVANAVVSKITNSKLCLMSKEEAHVIVDVSGYFSADGPLSYQPLAPKRLLDTRQASSLYTNRLGDRQVIELPIQDLPGMPAGIWAVTANLTVVGATQNGFLSAFPCGGSVPNTSSLNFPPNDPVGTVTVSSVGMNGNLCVFASSRAHLIVDILGVWTHNAALQPPAATVMTNPGDEGDTVDPGDPQLNDPIALDMGFDDGSESQPDGQVAETNGVQASEGCSVAGGSVDTSLIFMALLGLVGLRRRRLEH